MLVVLERSEPIVELREVRTDGGREFICDGGGGAGRRADEDDDGRGGLFGGTEVYGGEGVLVIDGLCGSRGGSGWRFGVGYLQCEMSFPAVVGLAIEDVETSSNDSSRPTASASPPSRSTRKVAIKLDTESGVLGSVVPPSEESETE